MTLRPLTLVFAGALLALAGCYVGGPAPMHGPTGTYANAGGPPGSQPVARPHTSRRAPVEQGLAYCNSSIDCGSGRWCKNRGDGIKLCMGKGAQGAYCSSSIDCTSGMWCKKRGDGYKVCMGKGYRGDSCSSSIDCSSGMWCKNRGDGLKVCM